MIETFTGYDPSFQLKIVLHFRRSALENCVDVSDRRCNRVSQLNDRAKLPWCILIFLVCNC